MSITQMNVGILTAGGVCPGVNNLIHSLTIYETSRDNRIVGFNEGFRGLNNNARMELSRKNIEEGAGSILRVSCESVDIEDAMKSMKDLERLYCICGNESMKSAAKLALDDRVDTNIIGIAKTIFNDIPGMESIGFQTAVQEFAKYIDYAYIEATTTNSIVFVEAPGHRVTELSTQATFAKYSKVTDVINKQTINNISKYQIKNNYETQGYAVVVVAETCEYQDVMDFLEEYVYTDIKVMNPGFVIRDTKACAYDTIMSVKVAREAFEDAQKFRNFVIGGNTKMTFENYLEIA
jgi:6-phosphofructokinase 1